MTFSSTEKRPKKEQLYSLFSQIAAAMANPHRLELLDLLAQSPRTVEELAQEASMSIANTSQHLQRLKQARLVVSEKEGLYVRYRLADPAVARLWLEMRAVAHQQLADVEHVLDAYRQRRYEFENVSVEELRTRLQLGEIILLDVRPEVEYENGHLPGALSLPLEEIEQKLAGLPDDKTIVAYCRGPYCVIADDALEILVAHGRHVARLEEGVLEWQQAGHAVSYE
ncbi:MAG: ArsR family transcriptional regulator [Anaerolineae bacterium]|nr:ArsR family transcriptional regulator [Anaerolineae bacterium]